MRPTRVVYPDGRTDLYQGYNSRGLPGTIVLADGAANERAITYVWHASLNAPLSRTEASAIGSGNKVAVRDYDDPAATGDSASAYNEAPTRLLRRVIEQGFTRNAEGSVIPYETITTYTYNAQGQVLSVDGPLAGTDDTVQFAYSTSTMDLLSVTLPLVGATALSNYDAAGYPGLVTDPNGNGRQLTRDGRCRLTAIQNLADSSSSQATFNLAGFLASTTDEDGVSLAHTYEATYGRLLRTTNEEGDFINNAYDDQGNVTVRRTWDQGTTNVKTRQDQWSYQSTTHPGLLRSVIQADGTRTNYTYDASGRVIEVTDPDYNADPPNGKKTTTTHDLFGRPATVTESGGGTTAFTYDLHGNMASVTDAEGRVTSYVHDDMGRLVLENSPDSGITTRGYDAAGNLAWKKDARGVIVNYAYDALSRPISTASDAYAGGSGGNDDVAAYVYSFTYDAGTNGKGHLTGVASTSPVWSETFGHDARGRLTGKTTTISGKSFDLSRTLTPGGRVEQLVFPSGRTVTFDRAACSCRVDGIRTTRRGTEIVLFQNATSQPFGGPSGLTFGTG